MSKPEDSAPETDTTEAVPEKNKTTRMVQKPKTVQIRADREIAYTDPASGVRKQARAGAVVEVTPEEADELCKPLEGFYAFSGERYGEEGKNKHRHYRAKRVETKQASV